MKQISTCRPYVHELVLYSAINVWYSSLDSHGRETLLKDAAVASLHKPSNLKTLSTLTRHVFLLFHTLLGARQAASIRQHVLLDKKPCLECYVETLLHLENRVFAALKQRQNY